MTGQELLRIALTELKEQETLEGLRKIWERYPVFHRNVFFRMLKDQLKDELKN